MVTKEEKANKEQYFNFDEYIRQVYIKEQYDSIYLRQFSVSSSIVLR